MQQINNFQTLEFHIVLKHLAGETLSPVGRARILSLPFITDAAWLKEELSVIEEARDLLAFDEPVPLENFDDLSPAFAKAEIQGAYLQPATFLSIRQFLGMVSQVSRYLFSRQEKCPGLIKKLGEIIPLPTLVKSIDRVVDANGEIKDNASANLSRIRREIASKSSQMRQRMQKLLQQMVEKGYAQEDVLALREGRLTIPLKDTHRRAIPGVMVDQSASGSTIFLEPLESLETNNAIRRLQMEEAREIEKLLIALTQSARENIDALEKDLRAMGLLDSVTARARMALRMDGHACEIGESVSIKNGRHPLLLTKMSGHQVVPLDLDMGTDLRTIIITGPNAGGKTVALKTVGLLACMHQHGLLIPAGRDSTLPLFKNIFADIGDKQSIDQDLSTFSSHIKNLTEILENADSHSLILLDEIGSSTDPAEGSALAMAILHHLTQIKAHTLATTHMGELKVFAHEEEGIENGSMIFDQETLEPTYRFKLGLPGSSYAFDISKRFGMPESILKHARSIAGSERGRLDQLIADMEKEQAEIQRLKAEADRKEVQLSGLITLYRNKTETLKKEGDARIAEAVKEAEQIVNEANKTIEQTVREIKEKQADKVSIREAKEAVQSIKLSTQKFKKKQPEDDSPPQAGDWVLWKGHGGAGRIISEPDSNGRVMVHREDIKLRIPMNQLIKTAPPHTENHQNVKRTFHKSTAVRSPEADLRGMTVDEALPAVDRFLGDAAVSGLHQVTLIHGKGTGALRKAVTQHLAKHPLVKEHRLGEWNEGDTGVTVVTL